jgi:hypothetical protein
MPTTDNPSLRPAKRDTKALLTDPNSAKIRGTGNPPNGFNNRGCWPDSAFFARKAVIKQPSCKTIRAGKK